MAVDHYKDRRGRARHGEFNTMQPRGYHFSHPQQRQHIIYFFEKNKPYYEFTNFSPHSVFYKGLRYPTSEHLFQAFKFMKDRPDLAERIRTCGEHPRTAFNLAHQFQIYVRSDWRSVNIQAVLSEKFQQHESLTRLLLDTGDAHLIENSPSDAFWGIGSDGKGQNQLGILLEELRANLRENQNNHSSTIREGRTVYTYRTNLDYPNMLESDRYIQSLRTQQLRSPSHTQPSIVLPGSPAPAANFGVGGHNNYPHPW